MNYKMFFPLLMISLGFVSMIDAKRSSLPSLGWTASEDSMTISVDTFKDIDPQSISITHKQDDVIIDFLGLDATSCSITLHSFNNSLSIALCAENKTSSSNEKNSPDAHATYYHSSYGASCRKEIIPLDVDFESLTAEYKGTVLFLKIPLVQKIKGRKIAISPVTEHTVPKEIKKNKKKYVPTEELKVDEK